MVFFTKLMSNSSIETFLSFKNSINSLSEASRSNNAYPYLPFRAVLPIRWMK